jgi:hypothetical protein
MTVVEWLVKELNLEGYDYTVEQAKKIEKEQIMNAHYEGSENYKRQYYNETFKTEKDESKNNNFNLVHANCFAFNYRNL